MAAISVRDLDDDVRERLRRRAAANGRSMESEARAILTEAVRSPEETRGLLGTLVDRMAEIGGVELEVPERAHPARAADVGQ